MSWQTADQGVYGWQPSGRRCSSSPRTQMTEVAGWQTFPRECDVEIMKYYQSRFNDYRPQGEILSELGNICFQINNFIIPEVFREYVSPYRFAVEISKDIYSKNLVKWKDFIQLAEKEPNPHYISLLRNSMILNGGLEQIIALVLFFPSDFDIEEIVMLRNIFDDIDPEFEHIPIELWNEFKKLLNTRFINSL